MRKFWMGLGMAVASAALAVAQDTTTDGGLLSGLAGVGTVGLVVLAVLAYFLWTWFIG